MFCFVFIVTFLFFCLTKPFQNVSWIQVKILDVFVKYLKILLEWSDFCKDKIIIIFDHLSNRVEILDVGVDPKKFSSSRRSSAILKTEKRSFLNYFFAFEQNLQWGWIRNFTRNLHISGMLGKVLVHILMKIFDPDPLW